MPWGRHQGGVPISHNALQHYPECHGADTGGGYPYPIMLCNISQNATEQTPGGTQPGPARVVPCRGVPYQGLGTPPQARTGGTLPGGYPDRVPPSPSQDGRGVPCQGGTLLGRGYPGRVPPGQGGIPCQGVPR